MRCGMGKIGCEGGMGTTRQTVGRDTVGKGAGSVKAVGKGAGSDTGNSREGNKTPYGRMVDGGNTNQRREGSGNRCRERETTRPLTFSRSDFCRTNLSLFCLLQYLCVLMHTCYCSSMGFSSACMCQPEKTALLRLQELFFSIKS